jgi:hypothetical protein
MVGSNIMNASSPTITHKAHSGDAPIIRQQLGDRYDLLWHRTVGCSGQITGALSLSFCGDRQLG